MDTHLSIIALVCRNDKGRLIHRMDKKLSYVHVLVVEAIAIRGALRIPNNYKMDNILLKSDSRLVINYFRVELKSRVRLLIMLQTLLL